MKRRREETAAEPVAGERKTDAAEEATLAAAAAEAQGSSTAEAVVPTALAPSSPAPLFLSGADVLDYVRRPPDFVRLAALDPSFAPFVRRRSAPPSASSPPRVSIEWKEAKALLALTRALLRVDFGLSFQLPSGYLCPPLPQRLAYLHWVHGLLGWGQAGRGGGQRGVDVGCGASCIFPLLGCRGFGDAFVATDCDPPALAAARTNVDANGMQAQVSHEHEPLLSLHCAGPASPRPLCTGLAVLRAAVAGGAAAQSFAHCAVAGRAAGARELRLRAVQPALLRPQLCLLRAPVPQPPQSHSAHTQHSPAHECRPRPSLLLCVCCAAALC